MNKDRQFEINTPSNVEFQIKKWLPVAGAIIAAVYAGYCVGIENWNPLIVFFQVAVICFVAIALQDRGWILIPLFWMATGSIALLRLPFSYRDIGIMLAVSAYVVHRCMVKTQRISMKHPLFFLIVLNLAWFLVAWIRKPVGLRVMETEMLGARFYINACLAFVAIWILIRLPHTNDAIERIPYYLIFGASLGAIVNLVVFLAPSSAFILSNLYSDIFVDPTALVEIQRMDIFRSVGILAVLIAVTHTKQHSLFNPLRPHFWIMLFGLAGVAIAGFRTSIAICFAYIILSLILRKNWRQLILSSLLAVGLLTAVVYGQGRFYSLPLAAQRSLTFLPGKWSSVAVEETTISNTRIDWWRDIIKYRLIKNWWLGDGIGARPSDMLVADENVRQRRTSYFEGILLTGTFHNGPLTTIRCVGIVGLLLLYALMIAAIFYALRCVKHCRDTRWESLSLFAGIPIIWFPFHFTILFGSFESDFPEIIFQTGILLLLLRMMSEHPEVLATHSTDS